MRGTNVIGLMLAIFLFIAVCVNGLLQEMDRRHKAEYYTKIEATVVGYTTNKDESYTSYRRRRYRSIITEYSAKLEYKVADKPYFHTMLHTENIKPEKGSTRTLYVNPSNPNDVMDSGSIWKEIGTFAFAGVALVWAGFQIYMGTKMKNATADERSGYFIMMIGVLITSCAIPLSFILGVGDLIVLLAILGISVTGWGIKDLQSQNSKYSYADYNFRR